MRPSDQTRERAHKQALDLLDATWASRIRNRIPPPSRHQQHPPTVVVMFSPGGRNAIVSPEEYRRIMRAVRDEERGA